MPRAHRLPCLLVAFALAFVAGCNIPSAENWRQVSPGLTSAEVVEILGEPSSRHTVPLDDRASRGYASWWQYGDNLSTLATEAVFSGLPDRRVYSVFFDAEGNVVSTSEPTEPR